MEVIGNQKLDMNQKLWRYFSVKHFLELLQTSCLYFASAKQFSDPFEGATAVLPAGFPIDPRYTEAEHYELAFEKLRGLTKINCWHRANYESDAMWQLYAEKRKGVAICTTPNRIRIAVQPFQLKPEYGYEKLWAGNVNYVDLLKERLCVGMIERFWYKHMAFSWEKEFRLGISVRIAEEFGVQVPELGIKVKFDIPQLVEKIYLGPSLSEVDIIKVNNAARIHGLENNIKITSLLGTPRYI